MAGLKMASMHAQVNALMREKANLVTRNSLLERVVALKEEQQHTLKHSSQDEVDLLAQAPCTVTPQVFTRCDNAQEAAAVSVHASWGTQPPQ